MASRSRDPARTREKILTHATVEFAKKGFDGARVDSIAVRCRLSKNMLYYYFKSKEGLFVAVLERMYEKLRAQQKDLAVRASDPVTALEQLVQHTFTALLDNPEAIRLMNEENRHKGRHIRQSRRMRDLYNPLVDTIRFILERGRDDGVFRAGVDPAFVYLSLSSLCYHYLSNQYTLEVALGVDLGSEQARANWLSHITELVMMFCTTGAQPHNLAAPEAKAARTPRRAPARKAVRQNA
ncbi:MAG: TetR family transcriptional regulator [Beijerinckiaceae bacterium]|nr:TetR family transcriptional regulator [Beijerinckiaceae bacterium]MDO9442834.1 TetR/AcrR family transcriptional regulator [Beijerinckiaceae bacterium]